MSIGPSPVTVFLRLCHMREFSQQVCEDRTLHGGIDLQASLQKAIEQTQYIRIIHGKHEENHEEKFHGLCKGRVQQCNRSVICLYEVLRVYPDQHGLRNPL